MKLADHLTTISGDELVEKAFRQEMEIASGSNFMTGNGYMGYRGTFMEDDKSNYAACIVSDTYDKADGKWRELCTVPNGLYGTIEAEGEKLNPRDESLLDYQRKLSLQEGVFYRKTDHRQGTLRVEKFASMDEIHALVMQVTYQAKEEQEVCLTWGIDGDLWSINGNHFQSLSFEGEKTHLRALGITGEKGIRIAVAAGISMEKSPEGTGKDTDTETEKSVRDEDKPGIWKKQVIRLAAGESLIYCQTVAIYTSRDLDEPVEAAGELIRKLKATPYQKLKEAHTAVWKERWEKHLLEVDADPATRMALKFNLYHNIIHVPGHRLLPIGARGLSCQAYQGAAFWDQEIFNLPMYLYTDPEQAMKTLSYRYVTKEEALKKAKRLGYRGAFYAWISGDTGEELCPDFFFKDILTGRPIRNHFNIWQIHISPDIGYAIIQYWEITRDWDFMVKQGYEMLVDICLFLISRAHYNTDQEYYEFIRLLGPDEYHENVDNNVFTNYQARYVLRETLKIRDKMLQTEKEVMEDIHKKTGMQQREWAIAEKMAEKIYVKEPDPETGLIEQFDGYFQLEKVLPAELKKRLLDPLEYWGWPNGVAVHTQVLKQADLLQLFVLHPNFDQEVLQKNYEYYEPLTEHGSSLSPAMHAIVAARIGKKEEAVRYFEKACLIDLNNSNKAVSGGTFIGGIHTASAGAVWQMMVYGFAGFQLRDSVLHFSPWLPEGWKSYRFRILVRGHGMLCRVSEGQFMVTGENTGFSTAIRLGSVEERLEDKGTLTFSVI